MSNMHEYLNSEKLSKVVVIFIIISLFSSGYYAPSFTLAMIVYGCFFLCNLREVSIKLIFKNVLIKRIMIFFACLFISLLFNYSNTNLIDTINFYYYSLPMFMLLHINLKYKIENTIKYTILFVLTLGFVFCSIEYFYFDINRVYGLLKNANAWASFLGLVLPLLIYGIIFEKVKFWNIYFKITLLLTIIMILGTGTRGIILVCVLLGILWMFYILEVKKIISKYMMFSIIGIIAIILLCNVENMINVLSRSYDIDRISAYIGSLKMWMTSPLVGIGFSNWSSMYSNFYMLEGARIKLKHAHNIYLQLLSTVGLIGLSGFIYFVLYFLKSFFLNLKIDKYNIVGIFGMIIFLLHGLVDGSLFVKSTARIFWLFLAIYSINLFDGKEESDL